MGRLSTLELFSATLQSVPAGCPFPGVFGPTLFAGCSLSRSRLHLSWTSSLSRFLCPCILPRNSPAAEGRAAYADSPGGACAVGIFQLSETGRGPGWHSGNVAAHQWVLPKDGRGAFQIAGCPAKGKEQAGMGEGLFQHDTGVLSTLAPPSCMRLCVCVWVERSPALSKVWSRV